jgi:hypothetical protein
MQVFKIRHHSGIRLGLLMADDDVLFWAPTPLMFEAARAGQESNGPVLTARSVADIAQAVGVGPEGSPEEVQIGTLPLEQSQVVAVAAAISWRWPPARACPRHRVPELLPATLLQRRPDIAAAERRVAAAQAQIGEAEAAGLPSLTLSASVGVRESALQQLLQAPTRLRSWARRWRRPCSTAAPAAPLPSRHAPTPNRPLPPTARPC